MTITNERITEIVETQDWSWVDEEVEVDPYLYILGLDPGGTTGVAMVRIDPEDDKMKPELVYLHQIKDGYDGFKDWFYGSEPGLNTIIVSEKWKERNIKGADRTPQYIEGAMRWAWGEENVVWQFPDKKELIPDQWLKDNNLWTEGHRHQMDALKHIFAFLRNDGHSATLESLSGRADEAMAPEGAGNDAQLSEPEEGEAGAQNPAEALAEALEAMAEAQIGDEQAPGEAAEGDEGEIGEGRGGQGGRGVDTTQGGYDMDPDRKYEGTRKKRERNGGFAGFEPEGADEGAVLLFED